jgi:superfamily I DNA/RNA helicase
MNIHFFSGGAGCGKTHRLMSTLTEALGAAPLQDGQQVLALTFMHGSRRRLDERLSGIRPLARKYECVVLDSFALKIVTRWRSLLASLGIAHPGADAYDKVCDAASMLLSHDFVAKWVAATYPIVILDEAQDLSHVRLNIVRNLAKHVKLLVAADEFQCLNEDLRPNPTVQWLKAVCKGTELVEPKRTNVAQLLDAASAVRQGRGPAAEGAFKIFPTANAGLAGSYIANAIAWARGRQIAVITTTANKFASDVVEWVSNKTNTKGNGPYPIRWERSDNKAAVEYLTNAVLLERMSATDVLNVITAGGDVRVRNDVSGWLDNQRRTKGRFEFSKAEVADVIGRSFTARKHGYVARDNSHVAMTVHGAKNREFDHVVVLWPAATGGDDEQKRRLLYNAITRAKRQCVVLVQAAANLKQPPFV